MDIRRKRASNRLFLLSFFDLVPVHQKGLAKRPLPYYALCSAGTSTQDVVDFDLQQKSGHPAGGHAGRGRGAEGKSERAAPKPASCLHCTKQRVPGEMRCRHSQRQDFDRRATHASHERFRRDESRPHVMYLAGEPGSAMPSADPRFAQYKVIRRNGAVVGFEPAKITHRDDQGLPRRQRRPGRGAARACATRSRSSPTPSSPR